MAAGRPPARAAARTDLDGIASSGIEAGQNQARDRTVDCVLSGARDLARAADQAEIDLVRSRIARTIEAEIIPRFLIAHETGGFHDRPSGDRHPTPVEIEAFTNIVLGEDAHIASAFVDSLKARGMNDETVCLELLSPTADRLGKMWENDEASFADVTIGLCRLHQVLREMGFEARHAFSSNEDRRVLLAPMPGEQHTFGVAMVEQFLRRAGWDARIEYPTNVGELADLVHDEWFALVGLSVAGTPDAGRDEAVADVIRAIRAASCNKGIAVMIGGSAFATRPGVAARVGADSMAANGREAVREAERLLALAALRC